MRRRAAPRAGAADRRGDRSRSRTASWCLRKAPQVDRTEGRILAQLQLAGARELEARRESRGHRRAPDDAAQACRQEARERAPLGNAADHALEAMERVIHGIEL